MKKLLLLAVIAGFVIPSNAQKISGTKVPAAAKNAFMKEHPHVKHIVWETENGNFEGNWKADGYDHSAMYTPDGKFAGSETGINPEKLPVAAREYVKKHVNAKIKEASLNEDSKEDKTYEADVKGKAYIFDINGRFIKTGEDD